MKACRAGFLTPGSFSSGRLPNDLVVSGFVLAFVPGYSGGGRAGLSPASLTAHARWFVRLPCFFGALRPACIRERQGTVKRRPAVGRRWSIMPRVTLRFLLSPSVGGSRAWARAELLQDSLGEVLGEPVQLDVAVDYEDLERRAREGEADLLWAPPGVCARIEPVARAYFKCIRHGASSYRSALVVRRGAATSLAELRGSTAAWVDPMSVGGYLLAIAHLKAQGLVPEELFREQHFHGNYPDALNAVAFGKADMAAIAVNDARDGSVVDALGRFAGRMASETLSHLAVTEPTPMDALVLTHALSREKLRSLTATLESDVRKRALTPLFVALEVDGFMRADAAEYAAVGKALALAGRW